MGRRRSRATQETGASTPDERHEEFLKENERWDREVEESLSDLKKLARKEKDGNVVPAKEEEAAGV